MNEYLDVLKLVAIRRAVAERRMANVIHLASLVIDLIVRKDEPYRRTEFERRRLHDIEDTEVWMVAPEDLVLSKLIWARAGSELQDTSPDVAIALRRLMMSRTGAERLGMVSELFQSAKRLESAWLQAGGLIDPVDLRVRLFQQLHAADLDEETVAAVIARLAGPA